MSSKAPGVQGGIRVLVVLAVACCAGKVFAQGAPDGYRCTSQAFTNIGGLHAVGTGEVEVSADTAYRPTATSFRYTVSDRISGLGRLVARWSLPADGPNVLGPIQSLRIPLHAELAERPVAVVFNLDGADSAPLATDGLLEVGAGRRVNAVTIRAQDATVPELAGHRSMGYSLSDADGDQLVADIFLLPDWRRNRSAIRSALRRAHSMLRRRECDPFYMIGSQQR